jgi:hypothetical protein
VVVLDVQAHWRLDATLEREIRVARRHQPAHRRPHLLFLCRGGGKTLENFRVLVPVVETNGEHRVNVIESNT